MTTTNNNLPGHTPGPWKVIHPSEDTGWSANFDGGSCAWSHIGLDADNVVAIAMVDAAFDKDDLLDANADLIAAAPELLEALREMVFLNETTGDPDEGITNKARAAIAKATGKESA